MRPADWLAANGAVEGEHIWLAFEEIKVDSPGLVTEVTSCPAFAPEPEAGCLVTGTFQHRNRDVMRIGFEDSDVVLEPTALHPFWSVERDDWIRAKELEPGHELRTDGGTIRVASVEWLREPEQVYDLEVAGDHYYLVSEARLLSHNSDGCNFVDLTGHRKVHILNRHRAGAGKRGKTEFPESWSDEEILHHISDVATDPNATHGVHGTTRFAEGTRDGVTIRVEFYPDAHPSYPGRISTGYPTN